MLEIRPTNPSPSGLEEVAELLAAMFPSATYINAAYLDWTYRQNPGGDALGFNAYAEGRLVLSHLLKVARLRLQRQAPLSTR